VPSKEAVLLVLKRLTLWDSDVGWLWTHYSSETNLGNHHEHWFILSSCLAN